jgi:hypothetical protein
VQPEIHSLSHNDLQCLSANREKNAVKLFSCFDGVTSREYIVNYFVADWPERKDYCTGRWSVNVGLLNAAVNAGEILADVYE